jgi:Trp operon repressor
MARIKKPSADIADVLRVLRTPDETRAFLEMLLTSKEIGDVQRRWMLVQLLAAGATQRQARMVGNTGIATATRAARIQRSHPKLVKEIIERLKQKETN